jgi:hypothetical protein
MSYVPSHNPNLVRIPNKRVFQDSLSSTGGFEASSSKAARLASIPGNDRGTPQNGFNIVPFEGKLSGSGSDHQTTDVKVVGTVHAKKKRYDAFPYEGAPMFYFRGDEKSIPDHVDNNTPAMHLLTLAEHNKYLASNSKFFATIEDLLSVTGFYAFLNNDDVSQARPITMYNKRAGNSRPMNICYYGETWSKAIFGLPIPAHDIYVVWALVPLPANSTFVFTSGADENFGERDLNFLNAEPEAVNEGRLPRFEKDGEWSVIERLYKQYDKLAQYEEENNVKFDHISGRKVWQAFLTTTPFFDEKPDSVVGAYQKVASPVKTNSSVFVKKIPTTTPQKLVVARNLFLAASTPSTKIYVSSAPPVLKRTSDPELKKALKKINTDLDKSSLERQAARDVN